MAFGCTGVPAALIAARQSAPVLFRYPCERAELWRSRLEQHTFVFGNFPLSVTASFGVSGYPQHGKAPEELTRSADAALYSAKRNGRNRVEMFEEAPIVFLTGKA